MESLFIITSVAALVEVGRRVKAADWFAVYSIVGAAVLGGVAGHFHIQDVANIADGVILGLSASGFITVASRVGGGGSVNSEVNNK